MIFDRGTELDEYGEGDTKALVGDRKLIVETINRLRTNLAVVISRGLIFTLVALIILEVIIS